MKYLLDVNILLAAIWKDHGQHAVTIAWLAGKSTVLCPLVELGFIRISTNAKAINSSMEKARKLLEEFHSERQTEFIADDLLALNSHAKTSGQVTDHYLASLAHQHGLKLATLDAGLKHPAAEIVS